MTWSIQEGAAGGTISATGLYTAPAVTAPTTYHVIATSQADTTESATLAVTVNPSVVVHVTGASGSITETQTDQFSATVTGSTNQAVTWSILERLPTERSAPQVCIRLRLRLGLISDATSQVDSSQSASASVVVTLPTPTFTSTPATTLGVEHIIDLHLLDCGYRPCHNNGQLHADLGPGSISGSTLSWTPTNADRMMPSSFTVTATNGLGGTNTQTWTVTPYRTVTMTLIDNFHYTGLVSLPVSSLTTPVAQLCRARPQPQPSMPRIVPTSARTR